MRHKELKAYQAAVDLAMHIFRITKKFPREERYALIDQMRRSSRSVAANLAESYRKRQYPKHFKSKLSDCDAENAETQSWIEFALKCEYIDQPTHDHLIQQSETIGRLIGYMMQHPDRFRNF